MRQTGHTQKQNLHCYTCRYRSIKGKPKIRLIVAIRVHLGAHLLGDHGDEGGHRLLSIILALFCLDLIEDGMDGEAGLTSVHVR
jgi:hypothetical protein